jgi:hypothetical protein
MRDKTQIIIDDSRSIIIAVVIKTELEVPDNRLCNALLLV